MSDEGCPQGHVWVTQWNAKVSVCKNCGADRPVVDLPEGDPLYKPQPPRITVCQKCGACFVHAVKDAEDFERLQDAMANHKC